MAPEQPQATFLPRRQAVAKPTAAAESEATNGLLKQEHFCGLAGSQSSAPASAIDFVKATSAAPANAAAFDSSQQSSYGSATTPKSPDVGNSLAIPERQPSRSLQQQRTEPNGRNAALVGQGGRFVGGDEAGTARASRISETDFGTPVVSVLMIPLDSLH